MYGHTFFFYAFRSKVRKLFMCSFTGTHYFMNNVKYFIAKNLWLRSCYISKWLLFYVWIYWLLHIVYLSIPFRSTSIRQRVDALPPCRWRAARWDHYRAVRVVQRSCASRGNWCRAHALKTAKWRAAAGHRASRARTRHGARWWARRRRRRPRTAAASLSTVRRAARDPPCRCRTNVLTGTHRLPMLPSAHIPALQARKPSPSQEVRSPCFA